jgi:hypothetical protein
MQKESLIKDFISLPMTDDDLPQVRSKFHGKMKEKDGFKGWSENDSVSFLHYQWGLTIPYFDCRSEVGHYVLGVEHVKPWMTIPTLKAPAMRVNSIIESSLHEMKRLTATGGYGEVHKIFIHPWQHNFGTILGDVSLIAISAACTLIKIFD